MHYRALSPAYISLLESGKRNWNPSLAQTYDAVLNLADKPIQRALGMRGLNGRLKSGAEYDIQEMADLLDALIGGDDLDPVDVVQTIHWVTSRSDPLGRASWNTLIERVISEASRGKGRYSASVEPALVLLSRNDLAAEIFLATAIRIAAERGNPRSFVPLIALAMDPRRVPTSWLIDQLESPDNRWSIRELLNLALSLVTNPATAGRTVSRRRQLCSLAHEWAIDSDSEYEVKRAAWHLFDELSGSPSIKPITEMPITQIEQSVTERYMWRVLQLSGAVSSGLGYDPILQGVLADLLGGRDDVRRQASRHLMLSGYRKAIEGVAIEEVAKLGRVREIDGVRRQWIRLLGKVGTSGRAFGLLRKLLLLPSLDGPSREVVIWSIVDLAVAVPPSLISTIDATEIPVHSTRKETFQRATLAALGRAGLRRDVENFDAVGDARKEKLWWLSNLKSE